MSNPTPSPPAGWYADPHGAPSLRWWDGTTWSDFQSTTSAPAQRRQLPADVHTDTLWIWLAVLLPLLSCATILLIDFRSMFVNSFSLRTAVFFPPGYFVALAISWSIAALVVVFSYLDWKALKAKGVDRPFHWAWAFFIGYPVYVIGRSVIVHGVSKRGLGPIWGYIAVFILQGVITVALMVWIFQAMFDYAGQYAPSYS